MPTLRQLRALSLIAQTGSFTKAAERLFVTQSAVSALIRDLEEEAGTSLIVRGRALRLTEAGEHLQRAGARAQQELDRALLEVQSGGQWAERVLRVGAGSLSAATLLPPAIARLRAQQGRLRVVLVDRPVGMVGDLLLSGEVDAALGSLESPLRLSTELRSELLLTDSLCVVASASSQLAQRAPRRKHTRWADLGEAELVLVGRVGGQWNSLLRDQLAAHPGLRIGHEVQLLSTALELVRHDLGVAVLPRFACRTLDLRAFWVSDLQAGGAKWSTYWLTRKAGTENSAAALLLDALRNTLGRDGS